MAKIWVGTDAGIILESAQVVDMGNLITLADNGKLNTIGVRMESGLVVDDCCGTNCPLAAAGNTVTMLPFMLNGNTPFTGSMAHYTIKII